ncbi:sigma-70 family RNA polymerase sigma factor [Nakamurella sp. UYEF19]|uniref:sigma-70 family RNA polymerase sigma factor n=1 Tax=Nakamurella sp. UYEF19 TaxID=1756392 RepID=UPI0033943F88
MRRRGTLRRADERPRLTEESDLRAAYDAHGSELYRFALRQLGDEGTAQDVVQDVFLRAWRSSASFDPEVASLRVWLFAIARNVVIDEARRRKVRPWQATSAGDPDPDLDRASTLRIDDQVLDRWIVEEALRRISVEHRIAIVEIHLRGRPPAEVAAEQGVAPGTIRSRVFYGLKALRLTMEEMGVEP